MWLYALYLVLFTLSVLMIREHWFLGWVGEFVFRLENLSFFKPFRRHTPWVALFKWPLLLAVLGLAFPSPWTFDFVVTFVFGVIYQFQKGNDAKKGPIIIEGKKN